MPEDPFEPAREAMAAQEAFGKVVDALTAKLEVARKALEAVDRHFTRGVVDYAEVTLHGQVRKALAEISKDVGNGG